MKAASAIDYRELARRRLPPFLFEYIDGGSYAEVTLKRNVADLEAVALRQRVLTDVSQIDLSCELFGRKLAMPVALAPVGLAGMNARRGEVQAARAEQRVDDHRRRLERTRVGRLDRSAPRPRCKRRVAPQSRPVGGERQPHLAARPAEQLGGNEALPANVARAAEDEDRPLGIAGRNAVGHRRPGCLHQAERGCACRGGQPGGAAHFGWGEKGMVLAHAGSLTPRPENRKAAPKGGLEFTCSGAP